MWPNWIFFLLFTSTNSDLIEPSRAIPIWAETLFPYFQNYLLQLERPIQENLQFVSEKCAIQIGWFFQDLTNFTDDDEMWALKMADASTKIPSGIMNLNVGDWMGSFDECLEIKSVKRELKGNYCLATLYIDIDFQELLSRDFFTTSSDSNVTSNTDNFQQNHPTVSYPSLGICIPDGCTKEDLADLVKNAFNFSFPIEYKCQTYEDTYPPLTIEAWIVISFFIFIAVFMISITAYDIQGYFYQKERNVEDGNDCENTAKTRPEKHILVKAFSMYTNGKKLFRSGKSESPDHSYIDCLAGIKVLSMLWVLIGHTFSLTLSGPLANGRDALNYIVKTESLFFANAVFAVDTFLMVSGLLVFYGFFKVKESEDSNITFGWLGKFYLHRHLRLTPAFAAVALVSATLLQPMGSGPHWNFITDNFQGFCRTNWWSSLIYFQNYIDVSHWCVGQTWYLNIDYQLYLLAPLFRWALMGKPIIGVLLLLVATSVPMVISFYVTWIHQLPAIVTNLYGNITNFHNLYYLTTHTRAAPWFIGAIYGYYIAQIKFGAKKIIRLPKIYWWISCGLSLTMLCGVTFTFGSKSLTDAEYHKWHNALFNSLARPTWAVCVGWICFCCVNGYGGIINCFLSLNIFKILNRFTYSIYLLHVTMIYMITFSAKKAGYFTLFNVFYSFWGITMISFILSIFWVLAFESPPIALEKFIFASRSNTSKEEPAATSKAD
ncbi:nose resistant to fluoxetine protein 6-like [Anthonomus grandis grandis]|uniref:nose resistant to fluoxetine protein 6-like n=1 Tax=Anthonomus grandis grandis TaxID=2921223 RepID=UPI00216591D0|nr:nose resistant to fluoxetine protein 6-like [Anthonomus grandis grandis]